MASYVADGHIFYFSKSCTVFTFIYDFSPNFVEQLDFAVVDNKHTFLKIFWVGS